MDIIFKNVSVNETAFENVFGFAPYKKSISNIENVKQLEQIAKLLSAPFTNRRFEKVLTTINVTAYVVAPIHFIFELLLENVNVTTLGVETILQKDFNFVDNVTVNVNDCVVDQCEDLKSKYNYEQNKNIKHKRRYSDIKAIRMELLESAPLGTCIEAVISTNYKELLELIIDHYYDAEYGHNIYWEKFVNFFSKLPVMNYLLECCTEEVDNYEFFDID